MSELPAPAPRWPDPDAASNGAPIGQFDGALLHAAGIVADPPLAGDVERPEATPPDGTAAGAGRRGVIGATVVVPTLNRGRYLENCLRDLLAQRHRPLEILVVDQSGRVSPPVLELLARWPERFSYHRVPFRGLPQARNYGWQHARYDAVIFVDDDVRCGPDLVSEHVRALIQPGVGVVAGAVDPPQHDGPPQALPPGANAASARRRDTGRFHEWTATPHRGFTARGMFEVDHAQGCNFSAWRPVLAMAGGIDERLAVGAALYEETEFCLRVRRLGYRILFNGDARAVHLAAGTGGCRIAAIRPYVWALGHNRAIVIRRHLRGLRRTVALGYLCRLGLAHAVRYRTPLAVADCLRGAIHGWREGAMPVRRTDW